MQSLKTYYVESKHHIDIESLKSNCIKKHFNINGTALVAFPNDGHSNALTFIFEGKCPETTLKCLSKLFLISITTAFPSLFEINQFFLTLNHLPTSNYWHYNTKEKGIFAHSIILRNSKQATFVAHSNVNPKEFSITVMNKFKTIYNDILN